MVFRRSLQSGVAKKLNLCQMAITRLLLSFISKLGHCSNRRIQAKKLSHFIC